MKTVKHKNLRLAVIVLFAVILSVVAGVSFSFAAGEVAKVSVNGGDWVSYTDTNKLINDLDNWDNKTVHIILQQDIYGKRVIIPGGSKVTIEMRGHAIDRDLSDDEDDGEVIFVDYGASLTLEGGEDSYGHSVDAYTSTKAKVEGKTIYGGVITGGYSDNGGGGIHLKSNCTLIANDVTIAGNYAEDWFGDGYGGGICVYGSSTKVILNNSTVRYNFCKDSGAGIYFDENDCRVEMNKSGIYYNYSDHYAGGVYLNGDRNAVIGDGESIISNNEAEKEYAGGIWVKGSDCVISGVEIGYNYSDSYGGGIYQTGAGMTVTDCYIHHNRTDNAGGICIRGDNAVLKDSTITQNRGAENYSGVYLESGIEGLKLSGKLIIKDNNQGGDVNRTTKDLFIPALSGITAFLTEGADVHFDKGGKNSDWIALSSGKGNCSANYLTCNDSNYVAYYNRDGSIIKDCVRYLLLVNKNKYPGVIPKEVPKEKVDPYDTEVVDVRVKEPKLEEYEVIKGYNSYPSILDSKVDNTAQFYYSDGYFADHPKYYNEHLATMSLNMAMAGFYLNKGGKTAYDRKHGSIRQLLADIGCNDEDIYVNEFNTEKPGTDTIGVTIGSKPLMKKDNSGEKVETGKILVPVAVRGAGYESEWASNVTLGRGDELNGEAKGFSEAAEIVFSEVNKYVEKHGLNEEAAKGNVKFWVTGFSRAGATANLTSRRLIEKYGAGNVYGYDFATPQGGVQRAKHSDKEEQYFGIHNIVNYSDLVPLVGPTEMGFERYGVDHYAPGKNTLSPGDIIREEKSVTRGYKNDSTNDNKVVTFRDNTPIHSGTGDYASYVKTVLPFLKAVDPDLTFDDYFHQATIDYIPGVEILERVFAASNEPKWTQTAEFERFFIGEMQKWVMPSREYYATHAYPASTDQTENKSTQEALREAVKLVFGHSDEALGNMATSASKFMDEIPNVAVCAEMDMLTFHSHVIKGWSSLNSNGQKEYIRKIWNGLERNGAFDELTPEEKADMKSAWPTLADLIFTAVNKDYDENWQDAFGTFAYNAEAILSNHYPERYLAWVRTEDSFYTGEDKPYVIDKEKALTPEITAKAERIDKSSDPVVLEAGKDKTNKLKGDHIVHLYADNIKGEIIYYTVKNKSTGTVSKRSIYRDGIELPCNTDEVTSYEMNVEAYSYDKEVKDVVFNVSLAECEHIVTIKTLNEAGETEEIDRACKDGEKVVVSADDSTDKYFTEWVVKDEKDHDVTDIIFSDNDSKKSPVAEITLPEGGGDSRLSTYYDLTFTGQYSDKISKVVIEGDESAFDTNSLLYKTKPAMLTAGSESSNYTLKNIEWTYIIKHSGDASGSGGYVKENDPNQYAYKDAKYTATAIIPADRINGIVFRSNTTVTMSGCTCTGTIDSSTGDLVIKVDYDWTTGDGPLPPDRTQIIQVKYVDMNNKSQLHIVTYIKGVGENFLLIAGVQENMKFVKWAIPDDLKLDDGSFITNRTLSFTCPNTTDYLLLTAYYKPVINEINIKMDAPEKNKQLPDSIKSLRVKFANDYYLDPACFDVSWTPEGEDGFAACETVYTASVSLKDGITQIGLVNNEGKMINSAGEVTENKNEQATIAGEFAYADNVKITVTGGEAALNKDTNKLYCTFQKTEDAGPVLLKVYKPMDITDVPFGTKESKIRELLPKTVDIRTEDYSVSETQVTWGSPTKTSVDNEEGAAIVYEFNGTVSLPEGVTNPRGISLETSIKVYVNEAETLEAPFADPEPGTYMDNAVVVLSGQSGVDIYYTKDGSTPSETNGTPYDRPINLEAKVGQSSTEYTIKAIAYKTGFRKSKVAEFNYTISKIIQRPESKGTFTYDGSSQLILEGSDYYTIKPQSGSGVQIDEFGNAFAKDSGVYRLTVSLKEGYFWENGSEEPSTKDMVVTRTIDKAGSHIKLESATFREDGKPKSIPKAVVSGSSGKVTYTYYSDSECTEEIPADSVIKKGKYYVKASVAADSNYKEAVSNVAVLTIGSKAEPVLLAVSDAYKKKAIKLTWNKPNGATKYVVYGQKCGKKIKKIKTTGKTSLTVKKIKGKKLKAHRHYKFYVVAYSGTKKLVSSKRLHVITAKTCGKRANITTISANSRSEKMTVGKKIKVSAVSKVYKGKKHITASHAPKFRYVSDCRSVATVDSKGNVTARAPGIAIIYIIDTGGKYCKTVITVE